MYDDSPNEFTVESWLSAHGPELTKAMSLHGDVPEHIAVTKLVEKPAHLVVRLEANGEAFVAKAFNPAMGRAAEGRRREVAALERLALTGLCPPLVAYSKDNPWLLMRFVEGKRLDKITTPESAPSHAHALGRWYRAYTDAMVDHGVSEPSNWFDYLRKVEAIGKQDNFDRFRSLLEPMTIDLRLVTKGDGGFQNYLLDQEGDLIGLDFERSTLKPYGWDILVSSAQFAWEFPDIAEDLMDALLAGWSGGTDRIVAEEMRMLAQFFVAVTANGVGDHIKQG